MDYVNRSDEELITLLREGDERVTDFLMRKYKDIVRIKAGNMFIIGADKDDLIQEGMIGLFKAIMDYDAGRDASFATFADLCILRQMYKAVEAGNRKKHAPLNYYVSLDASQEMAEQGANDTAIGMNPVDTIISLTERGPEELVIDRENTRALEESINASLSEFERQVLSLHLTGLNYVEIARILGKDEKSSDNALSRVKLKVKKILMS